MSTYTRWTDKLRGRKRLLAAARAAWRKSNNRATAGKVRLRERQVSFAARVVARHRPRPSTKWGGSRAVTDEVIRIVAGRAPVTSRKRTAMYGTPGSDHHVSQKQADAVDFGTAPNYALAREIAQKLGGRWLGDYDAFTITRNGQRYRVQIIAGPHGTGPHLHVGVRRV